MANNNRFLFFLQPPCRLLRVKVGVKASANIRTADGVSNATTHETTIDSGSWGTAPRNISIAWKSSNTSVLRVAFSPSYIHTSDTQYCMQLYSVLADNTASWSARFDSRQLLDEWWLSGDMTLAKEFDVNHYSRLSPSVAFTVSVAVGNDPAAWAIPLHVLTTAPQLTGIEQPHLLSTAGGESIKLYGYGLGVEDGAQVGVRMFQSHAGGRSYNWTCGYREKSGSQAEHVHCVSVAGVGKGYYWQVTVGRFASEPSSFSTSYAPPVIFGFSGEVR